MDLMLLAVSFFTVVVTMLIGFIIIQKLFPNYNRELAITKAFKESDYEKVISLAEGKNNSTKKSSFNVYDFTAQSYSSSGQHHDAIRWWELALVKLTLTPTDRAYLEVAIGDEYTKMGELKTAEVYYRTAVSIEPDNGKANHHLAQNLYNQKQYEKARKILREVLKKSPAIIESRILYAECLASMGLYARAIRHYGLLERINENVLTYNYALTLKNIKVWSKAYEVYLHLLDRAIDRQEREIIISDLIKVCMSMRKYADTIGLIDKYLPILESTDIIFELKYIRANIFYLKGDQMIALREHSALAAENPSYKDIKLTIVDKEKWLNYPFLFNYFTSNEALFETLVTRLAPAGAEIIRRTPQYYICMREPHAYVFYRDMSSMTNNILFEIEDLCVQFCHSLEKLELWCLSGLDSHRTITGQKYQFLLHEGDEFLVQTNIIVSQMDHLDGADPLNFVEGYRDLDEIIIKTEEEINETVDNIINDTPEFLEDDFISKALD